MTGQSRLGAGIDLCPETVQVVSYAALFAAATQTSASLFYETVLKSSPYPVFIIR